MIDSMEDSKLLENILTLDETENGGQIEAEPTLVDVYQDLILMTESLKSGIEKLLEKEGPIEEEEEEEEEDEPDSDDDNNNSEDDEADDEERSDQSGDEDEITEVCVYEFHLEIRNRG